ncbi:MAG: InlB B-repeat-containing protein [Butyrivibrio sp.]|nr:InlB B-repeat-containing protein [Butyrivibrio sp.]
MAPMHTVSLAAEQDHASIEQSGGGGVIVDKILLPDGKGQYFYTYENVIEGRKYALLVVSGVYESLDAADMDRLTDDLLYIDQKTADRTTVSFDSFAPAHTENSTVIISAEDLRPIIVGYISKDILKAGDYVTDTSQAIPLNDTIIIPQNTSWDDLKQTLPVSCYMEFCSDYMPHFYKEVRLTWRECEKFNSTKAGNTFQITADVSLPDDTPDILKTLAKPFTATVMVQSDTQKLYTVSFQTGCGQTIPEQNIAAGEKVAEPVDALAREGYVFACWEFDGEEWNFASDVVERDMVLRAKWLKKQGDADFYCYADEEQDYIYTGKAWKPLIVIKDKNSNTLRLNKDYSIKYVNNVQVSSNGKTAKAVITGKGNYTGKVEVSFNILAKDIADENAVSMKLNRCNPYKKTGYKPVPTGKYKGKTLKKNKDFTVSYQKLDSYDSERGTTFTESTIKDAGWYLVTVTGTGNYTGSRTFRFEIAPAGMKNLANASLKLDKTAANILYTGEPVTISSAITLRFGKTTLIEGEDYILDYQGDNTSIGKKQVIARALPQSTRCYGEKVIRYTVTGLSMKQTAVHLKQKNIGYTGTFISDNVESVTIKLDKKKAAALSAYYGVSLSEGDTYTLKENTDYTVSYRKYENAGKAVVIFTGKGIFSGKIESTFIIDKIDLSDSKVTASLINNSVKQNKSGAVAAVKITYDAAGSRITLREGIDYTVSYKGNKAAGQNAKAVIRGKGNFNGGITMDYTIEKKALTDHDIRISVINPVNAGKKSGYIYKPKVMVYDGGALLKEKSDYMVDYSGCITQENVTGEKSNGYIIIKAKENGSYSGSRTAVYQVQPYDIADKKCAIAIADRTYTGKAIEFNLDNPQDRAAFQAKMTLDGGKTVDLTPGEDFEIVSYSNNTVCGTARVVIKGTGGYGGSRTVKFKIVKQKLQP